MVGGGVSWKQTSWTYSGFLQRGEVLGLGGKVLGLRSLDGGLIDGDNGAVGVGDEAGVGGETVAIRTGLDSGGGVSLDGVSLGGITLGGISLGGISQGGG